MGLQSLAEDLERLAQAVSGFVWSVLAPGP